MFPRLPMTLQRSGVRAPLATELSILHNGAEMAPRGLGAVWVQLHRRFAFGQERSQVSGLRASRQSAGSAVTSRLPGTYLTNALIPLYESPTIRPETAAPSFSAFGSCPTFWSYALIPITKASLCSGCAVPATENSWQAQELPPLS
jgi:hypothetical protein